MSTPNEDENEMSLEKFKMFNINALKSFLYVRGKNNEGTLEELAARAFVAHTEKVQPISTLEDEERTNSDLYRQKLIIDELVVPDPLSLKDGWLSEANSIIKWPNIYYMDIADHLSVLGPEFLKQLQRDYKVGKSFRYYASDFLREIYYHPISDTSLYCILRGRIIPSHNTGLTPYTAWIMASNESKDNPGGTIESAYCTCIGGLAGTCNHVTALLFRVERAVITGMTNPSKTSRLCQWNIPSGTKVNLEPMAAEQMLFQQHSYANVSERDLEKERDAFIAYQPSLHQTQNEELQRSNLMRNKLFQSIKDHIKGSRICEIIEKKAREVSNNNTLDVPKTLTELVNEFIYDKTMTMKENVNTFISNIEITEESIQNLKKLTVKQAESADWKSHRYGRLTASNFYRIYTRVETLKSKSKENANSLVESILNKRANVSTKATRHGKALEPIAKKKFIYLEKKKHKNFIYNEAGLVLVKNYPFIGASPDLEIDCECCGAGLVEIKCPYSILSEIPNDKNLPYLEEVITEENKITKLKKKTAYYYQIQGQLAATQRKYCDFFVFTHFGHHLERILFDPALWQIIQSKLVWFWINHVAPALLKEKVETPSKIDLNTSTSNIDFSTSTITKPMNPPSKPLLNIKKTDVAKPLKLTNNIPVSTIANKKNVSTVNKNKKTAKTVNPSKLLLNIKKTDVAKPSKITNKSPVSTIANKKNVSTKSKKTAKVSIKKTVKCKKNIKRKHSSLFLCGECKKDLVETPKSFKEESVGCDRCPIWYHFTCASITPGTKPEPGDPWVCKNCKI